ncbi:T9SS type A sorting domain-containing protein [Bacteroidota bacterium]
MKEFSIFLIIFLSSYLNIYSQKKINVPEDLSSIQEAINYASTGDTILVQPGTYEENLDFNGKRILLSSLILTSDDTSYISKTIVDGMSNGSVVKFSNGENESAIINGFTLVNGSGYPFINFNDTLFQGGGIFSKDASPTILNLKIMSNSADEGAGIYLLRSDSFLNSIKLENNSAYKKGGGLYCRSGSPRITHSKILKNSSNEGGGIYISSGEPLFKKVNISGNTAVLNGAAIFFFHGRESKFINNTISQNNVLENSNGGSIYSFHSFPIFTNCIIWQNGPNEFDIIQSFTNFSELYFYYSDIRQDISYISGVATLTIYPSYCISEDPLFIEPEFLNFNLNKKSPCIDIGDPDLNNNGLSWEHDEEDRDPDGTRFDLGAYYFNQAITSLSNSFNNYPYNFELYQNYPNPFNPSTIIEYSIPKNCFVQLDVYNLLGERVTSLVKAEQNPSTYTVKFNSTTIPSGLYIYRLKAGNFVNEKKMMYLK